jgi:hypothetical protein
MNPLPGCTGKNCFTRFSAAAAAAKRMRRQKDDAIVHAYHCCNCGSFHVGESIGAPVQRRERRKEPTE